MCESYELKTFENWAPTSSFYTHHSSWTLKKRTGIVSVTDLNFCFESALKKDYCWLGTKNGSEATVILAKFCVVWRKVLQFARIIMLPVILALQSWPKEEFTVVLSKDEEQCCSGQVYHTIHWTAALFETEAIWCIILKDTGTLEEPLLPYYHVSMQHNRLFQPYNCPIHTTGAKIEWFSINNIKDSQYPGCSLDLSPIETL